MPKKQEIRQFTARCAKCGMEWTACEVRKCPMDEKPVCRYCCMKCPNVTHASTWCGCKK